MNKEFDHLGYNKELKELARQLRKNSTKAEIRLWSELLRAGKMKGYTFLRQRPVLNFIADFMCKELKLIIEVDGYTHENERQWFKDKSRQKELEEYGFTVLRFMDKEVIHDLENVSREIEHWIESHPPAPPSKGDESQSSIKKRFSNFIINLQDEICSRLEDLDAKAKFQSDDWDREGGGGGHSRIISNGGLIEKGGVSTSTVHGELPEPIKKRFEVEQGWFWAGGISLVIHPWSPMIPTVHANFRYFELYDDEAMTDVRDCWFGGGADLTPYYLWDEDALHFHQAFKKACDLHGDDLYPRFKKECDEYFYNDHRNEARGIGGLFFDYLRANDERSAEDWYDFTTEAANAFLDSCIPIMKRREDESYTDEQRYFQEIRRGRYVEFNLIHDRGTLFGLKTGGRTESVLMSLPPEVRWDYDFQVEDGSREAYLIERLKHPIDWIAYGKENGINPKSPFEGGLGGWPKDNKQNKGFDHLGYNKELKELARELRNNSTKAEVRLWSELLRAGKMKGYTFLRQRPALNFIADFMCKELKLIIEVDGYTHENEKQWFKDTKRQKELEKYGFRVLRFTDEEVMDDLENVSREIKHWIENHPPAPPSKGDKNP